MKKAILSSLFSLAVLGSIFSQEKAVKFTVQVSADSILFGNYFEVKFTLENANGQDFEAPDFSGNFTVVSGPNTSSSISMVNGDMTQTLTYTYYLEPKELGAFYILPASVNAAGQMLETAPLEVLVVSNPDGIRQLPPREQDDLFNFQFSDPFEGLDFGFPDTPGPQAEPAPEPKEKLKTKRI